jgi:hypothetical protein
VRQRAELVCCGIEGAEFNTGDNHYASNMERHKLLVLLKIAVEEVLKEMQETGEATEEDIEMMKLKYLKGMEYKDIANALASVAKCEIQMMQVGRLAPGRPSKDRGDSFRSIEPDEEDEIAEADNG